MATDDSVPVDALLGRDGFRLCGECGQPLYGEDLSHTPPRAEIGHILNCFYLHDPHEISCENNNRRMSHG